MIEFVDQMYPSTQIDWFHSEQKVGRLGDIVPRSSGPSERIPVAVFNVDTGQFYYWEDTVEW